MQIRFFRRILAPYEHSSTTGARAPFLSSSSATRSYLVTLPFADLTPHVPSLHLLCTGASAIELRADLLSDPHPHPRPGVAEAYENPSLSYISEQHALLRRHAPDIPIVFTLRTPAQGGKYPYPSGASEEGLFATLHHALKLGTDLIDIEQGLDPVRTARVVADAKQRQTTVIISWRDVNGPAVGGFSWSGPEARRRYEAAVDLGADIVKIVGTASDVQDNFLLRVFAFSDLVKTGPPLSAYNMGPFGRMSRFLNPLLASVTHPVAKQGTRRGVVGAPSMTFREVQMALHLSGLLSRRHFVPFIRDDQSGDLKALREVCERGFEELGLPFELQSSACSSPELRPGATFGEALALYRDEPFFAGGCVIGEAGISALESMDDVTEIAASVGGIDSFVVDPQTAPSSPLRIRGECVPSTFASEFLDLTYPVGNSHVYTRALLSALGDRISPSNAVSPTSFAVVLAPDAAIPGPTISTPSSSPPPPTPSQTHSLRLRSVLSALSRLGIRQVAVLDPKTISLEHLASKRPTIVITLQSEIRIPSEVATALLGSPTGGTRRFHLRNGRQKPTFELCRHHHEPRATGRTRARQLARLACSGSRQLAEGLGDRRGGCGGRRGREGGVQALDRPCVPALCAEEGEMRPLVRLSNDLGRRLNKRMDS